MKQLFALSIGLIFLYACKPQSQENTSKSVEGIPIDVKYAKGFQATDFGSYKLVEITDPTNESDITYKYALLQRGESSSNIPSDYSLIEVPIRSTICMTNLQLSNFIKLRAVDKVSGITSTRFLFNKQINDQLKDGRTSKIGIEGEFDTEIVLALNPDIILVSPFKRGGYDAILNLDIPLVSFLGYKEITPLGQAEWIKFTAMLLGLEEQAQQQFDDIEKKYNELKSLTSSVSQRPTVLSGELHSGNWYVVGGKSYLAKLFQDAGADYFMHNDNESGGFYLDYESVYAQGANADYWRVLNSYNGDFSYEAMKQTDERYADFKAYKDKKVLYCNLRNTAFYEGSTVEPEVVLADLIHIFHPTLLPNHRPVYYSLLK